MHFIMLSALCFNLDQSKILSSGNGLKCEKYVLFKGNRCISLAGYGMAVIIISWMMFTMS